MHSKRNHQQNERQSTEWEKIFAKNVTVKGLIPKIHKHLIQLNIEKQIIQSEVGKKTWRDISPRKTQITNKHMERCLISRIIREMQTKIYNKVSPDTGQNGSQTKN